MPRPDPQGGRLTAPPPDRIAEALRLIEEARVALTGAVCLLGLAEGKEAVQLAHRAAGQAGRLVQLVQLTRLAQQSLARESA